MKKVLIFSFLIVSLFSLSCQKQVENVEAKETVVTENVRDGVFIHITHAFEDAHRVLMPMKMATIMHEDKDVLLYLDIEAVKLVVKNAEDLNHEGFDSFKTYLNQLIEKGVEIYACPTCLQAAGFSQNDLIDGVKPADKNRFFDFTKGRILTLDY